MNNYNHSVTKQLKIFGTVPWAKGCSTEIQEITRRKLRMLNNSVDTKNLLISPSNRLEILKGKLKDFCSI